MTALTYEQVYAVARGAGFDRPGAIMATAIARAESGHNPSAHNGNANTGDNSYGLWQINLLGKLGPPRRKEFGLEHDSDLFDPATNARAAYSISGRGRTWTPWSAYKHGSHKQYLARARQAAATVGEDWADHLPGPTTAPVPAARVVSLADVIAAAKADPTAAQGKGRHPADVRPVEAALKAEGLLEADYAGDGTFGTKTLEAYRAWQARLADGIPDRASLSALGARHGFTVK